MAKRSMNQKRSRVAIVVPAPVNPGLTEGEEISLRHLRHFLGSYDRYMLLPRGKRSPLPGFRPISFDAERYFGTMAAHTRLMLSREFYKAFERYEFILIHHLDALVLSDGLEEWCAAGYDFIGAPWLQNPAPPYNGFSGVGNGGFSLRKVASFLRVFDSRIRRLHPDEYWRRYHAKKSPLQQALNLPKKYAKYLVRYNGIDWDLNRFRHYEDKFWSKRGSHYDPTFKVAPVEVALRFAFECAPRYCFEQNGHELPFGCHAWERYDRAFWEPYLLGPMESIA
jgi:hypothetical protein